MYFLFSISFLFASHYATLNLENPDQYSFIPLVDIFIGFFKVFNKARLLIAFCVKYKFKLNYVEYIQLVIVIYLILFFLYISIV